MDFDVAIGRIVTYLHSKTEGDTKVLPAMIVKLWGGDTVNLTVFVDHDPPEHDHNFAVTSVIRGDEPGQWLPYAERNIAVPN